MAKRKKNTKITQNLFHENYIRQKSRSLPVYECWINQDWEEGRSANVIITRKHSNGNFTAGIYLVDLLCLGVVESGFRFNIYESEYKELIESFGEIGENQIGKIDYALAHNIIFAALEFADDYGFKPHKDFTNTLQYFLEEDKNLLC